MKRVIVLILVLTLFIGLSAFADAVGLSSSVGIRPVFEGIVGPIDFDAGAAFVYQFTPASSHTQHDFYLTLEGGVQALPFVDNPV